MKKHRYIIGIAAFALVAALPAVSHAEDSSGSNDSVEVQATTSSTVHIVPGQIRNMIRQDIQQRVDNMKNNQNSRNGALEGRTGGPLRPQLGTSTQEGTSTRPFGRPLGDDMRRFASTTMMGSTSPMFRGERDGYMNNGREMLARMFRMRKEAVTHEADVALRNLSQIRDRIDSRIQKEKQAGKDMTAPISLLATADAKIKIANDAVLAFKAYMPGAASTTATSTVDLATARTMLKTAQSAIKDAQKSLNDVVRALAKAIGLHLGENNDHKSNATSTTATSTSQ